MFTPTMLRVGLMLLIAVISATQLAVSAQTPAGTWELYPAQTSSYCNHSPATNQCRRHQQLQVKRQSCHSGEVLALDGAAVR